MMLRVGPNPLMMQDQKQSQRPYPSKKQNQKIIETDGSADSATKVVIASPSPRVV